MPHPPHCILVPPMTTGANDVWVFRIVHQDTGKPAQGVPVTVLDRAGNAEGHWVSDADGTVAIPRRETAKLRLRVGLRSEDPIELATATLSEGPTPLAAPTHLPPTIGSIGHVGERAARDAPAAQPPPPRAAEQPEVPGHVLYFQRLVMFAERAAGARSPMPGGASPSPRDGAIDFFSPPTDGPPTMRYGVLVEVEEYWQSLGVLWGELLYSVTLTPGDEAKLAVLDGRWRREAEGRERPLQILARMVGTSMLGDLITALRPDHRRRARPRGRGGRHGPADPRPHRAHEPRAAPPAARCRGCPGRHSGDGRDPSRAQHHAQPARHLPFLRAAGALQGDGAESARSPRRVRAVPAAPRGDARRGAALRLSVPAHAAGPRPAPRPGAAAVRRR